MKVTLSNHDPQWIDRFNSEAITLRNYIHLSHLQIEHIGSTSVPNLKAKPIIDILIGVQKESDLSVVTNSILEIPGYYYVKYWEDIMPFRRFFMKVKDDEELSSLPKVITDRQWTVVGPDTRTFHIHCVQKDHGFFHSHIRFREILRSDPEIRNEYAVLKEKLSLNDWESTSDYAKSKSGFIEQVLSRPDFNSSC